MAELREPLLSRGSWPEAQRIAALLRRETVGGALLIAAAIIALVWANSPASASYFTLRDTSIGPAALHLNLTVGEWAADGLLAIFFFVAGLELKREFLVGDLRDPRRAALPIAAAVGGMIVPGLIYIAILIGGPPGTLHGWAIPTATDIAFSLAILAVVSTHLPTALRTFLLTLAIVDDLLAIIVIACFYTESFSIGFLLLTFVPLALFTLLVQRRVTAWWLLMPLALITWSLMHASGVHATVAGVLLAFAVPVKPRRQPSTTPGIPGRAVDQGPDRDLAERFEHLWRPISAGVAVPLFALFAAGVDVGGWTQFVASLTDRLTVAVAVALVVGKTIGVWLAARLVAAFTHATLAPELSWWDVFGVAMLAGMGFTVSLLIGELAFGTGTPEDDAVKIGVIVGSVIAALLAAVALRVRNSVYRRIADEESVDSDSDGTPDVYQQPPRPAAAD